MNHTIPGILAVDGIRKIPSKRMVVGQSNVLLCDLNIPFIRLHTAALPQT